MWKCGKCGSEVEVVITHRWGGFGETLAVPLWFGCVIFWLGVGTIAFPVSAAQFEKKHQPDVFAKHCAKLGVSGDSVDDLMKIGVSLRRPVLPALAVGLAMWLMSRWLSHERSKTYRCLACDAGIELLDRHRRSATQGSGMRETGKAAAES